MKSHECWVIGVSPTTAQPHIRIALTVLLSADGVRGFVAL
jgi:hypothetical protein